MSKIACYNKDGPICKYCKPTNGTGPVYGIPRYKCIHPLEGDDPIDPDEICECPESYRINWKVVK